MSVHPDAPHRKRRIRRFTRAQCITKSCNRYTRISRSAPSSPYRSRYIWLHSLANDARTKTRLHINQALRVSGTIVAVCPAQGHRRTPQQTAPPQGPGKQSTTQEGRGKTGDGLPAGNPKGAKSGRHAAVPTGPQANPGRRGQQVAANSGAGLIPGEVLDQVCSAQQGARCHREWRTASGIGEASSGIACGAFPLSQVGPAQTPRTVAAVWFGLGRFPAGTLCPTSSGRFFPLTMTSRRRT